MTSQSTRLIAAGATVLVVGAISFVAGWRKDGPSSVAPAIDRRVVDSLVERTGRALQIAARVPDAAAVGEHIKAQIQERTALLEVAGLLRATARRPRAPAELEAAALAAEELGAALQRHVACLERARARTPCAAEYGTLRTAHSAAAEAVVALLRFGTRSLEDIGRLLSPSASPAPT